MKIKLKTDVRRQEEKEDQRRTSKMIAYLKVKVKIIKEKMQYISSNFLHTRINNLELRQVLLTAVSFFKSEEDVFPANFVTPEGVWENVYTHKIWVIG